MRPAHGHNVPIPDEEIVSASSGVRPRLGEVRQGTTGSTTRCGGLQPHAHHHTSPHGRAGDVWEAVRSSPRIQGDVANTLSRARARRCLKRHRALVRDPPSFARRQRSIHMGQGESLLRTRGARDLIARSRGLQTQRASDIFRDRRGTAACSPSARSDRCLRTTTPLSIIDAHAPVSEPASAHPNTDRTPSRS